MGTPETRRKKIEWLKDKISAYFKSYPEGKISKEKLIAQFAVENNSTIRTGEELIEILGKVKFIKIKKDEITK